ncbi:hypothetical protein SS05631_a44180 (plasmid) [Sinorhizobium sp. CCBAU 05631]|nr:hypothetical protein SS05631_a44180 [Sinorhizobium sp. CCBAU 05631]
MLRHGTSPLRRRSEYRPVVLILGCSRAGSLRWNKQSNCPGATF